MLHSSSRRLFRKNQNTFGKRGFKYKSPRLVISERMGVIDSFMKVYYLPSMEDSRFVVSAYNHIDYINDSDYEMYFNTHNRDDNYFKNMAAIVVGEIVDCESQSENIDR